MVSPLSGSLARTIGRAFNGLFLDATLTRDVTPSTPAYESFDPPAPVATTYTCKAIRDNYSAGYMAQGFVQANDVKIIVLQTTLSVTPQPGDRITIDGMGGPWTIVPADTAGRAAVTADPANATYELRARS